MSLQVHFAFNVLILIFRQRTYCNYSSFREMRQRTLTAVFLESDSLHCGAHMDESSDSLAVAGNRLFDVGQASSAITHLAGKMTTMTRLRLQPLRNDQAMRSISRCHHDRRATSAGVTRATFASHNGRWLITAAVERVNHRHEFRLKRRLRGSMLQDPTTDHS